MNAKQKMNKSNALRMSVTAEKISTDIGGTILYFISCLACLIGTWGLLCLLFGLSHSGGLYSLGKSWIAAVMGL